jgi:UDP-N-acetylmuramyl pentapeptide phosphotransferase/UDP-N-acetylglucosamine-1-phosphate transferase
MSQKRFSAIYVYLKGLPKVGVKLFIMLVLSGLAYGLSGMGVILIMFTLSHVAVGRDSEVSHGISSTNSSRLGGLAIGLIFAIFVVGLFFMSPYTPGVARDSTFVYLWSAVVICCLLGLSEDIRADYLSPTVRLLLKFLVFGGFLWFAPDVVPQSIGIFGIDALLENRFVAWLLVTIFCVGFINAFNMADGANGLIPGVVTVVFAVFFMEYGRPAEGLLLFICSLFLIFNVVSGWYFLGDMGSYGLGSIIVCYGVLGVAQGDFSAGFMASLLAYPCVDFVFSVLRRLRQGISPFSADNGHLHNHLHRFYASKFKSRVLPNSLTGLTISGLSSGLAFALYYQDVIPITSNQWFWVFGLEALLYFLSIRALTARQPA